MRGILPCSISKWNEPLWPALLSGEACPICRNGKPLNIVHELQQVALAVQQCTAPVKLNYEIHGNSLPHLHVHIFPRYRGDAFEGGPFSPRAVKQPVYGQGAVEAFVSKLQAALSGK